MKIKVILFYNVTPFFKKDLSFNWLRKEVKVFKGSFSVLLLLFLGIGFFMGLLYGGSEIAYQTPSILARIAGNVSPERVVINVIKQSSPAVVSIIIEKEFPIFEGIVELDLRSGTAIPKYEEKGTEKRKIGSGTGFIVSEDGLILTNKHVVSDKDAEFTVVTNDGKKFTAIVLDEDPVQDLAILKIEGNGFPVLELGDSSFVEIGQSVIVIGNALGEFSNSASLGIISGLKRTVLASDGGSIETLEDVIQTDAAINKGNSGGPLLNLKGEVIGITVATAESAQSISFAIPINRAKRDIEQVKTVGKISYPFLGVRSIVITQEIKEEEGLSVDHGALLIGGNNDPAIILDSAADSAGLKENDIILEIDGKKINRDHFLSSAIQDLYPGDEITLLILRDGEELFFSIVLGER